jgi:DNA-binding SARP family transcriptional activator
MIRFCTLGGLDLRDSEGRELRPVLTQSKRAALLAYLALADSSGFRRRDTVVSMFWPESDDLRARAALRQAIRFLRRAMGDGVVLSRGEEEIGIDTREMWLDAIAFELAAQEGRHIDALELYRGPFLDGVHVSDASPELERWMDGTRARYARLAAATAWSAAEFERRRGDHVSASRLAHRGYETAPDDEASLRRLVSFLDDLGDRSGALAAYDTFARRLNDDGGMEPAPETIADAAISRIRRPGIAGIRNARSKSRDAGGGRAVIDDRRHGTTSPRAHLVLVARHRVAGRRRGASHYYRRDNSRNSHG